MRNQGCREASLKAEELCLSEKKLKKMEPVTRLCKEKGNAPLQRCATTALEPIIKIKNKTIRKAVLAEANLLLRTRGEDGKLKERLTQPEIEAIIEKHSPNSKKKPVSEKPPTYRLNKQQHTILGRMVALKVVSNEKDAFITVFKWAAERITAKKK